MIKMKCTNCLTEEPLTKLTSGWYKCPACKAWIPEIQESNKEEEIVIKEIKTVKEIILNLLETDERCRNDDKYLTYKVMRHFTKIYIPFEDFCKIPAFETIKRVRAQIQNVEKRFLPTDEIVINRRNNRRKVFKKQFFGGIKDE